MGDGTTETHCSATAGVAETPGAYLSRLDPGGSGEAARPPQAELSGHFPPRLRCRLAGADADCLPAARGFSGRRNAWRRDCCWKAHLANRSATVVLVVPGVDGSGVVP